MEPAGPKRKKAPKAVRRRAHGEGSVYFDTSRDRWVGQLWIDGRRTKVSGRTREEATAKIGRLLHGDPSERVTDRRGRVAGLLEDWKKIGLPNRDRAPATIAAHEWAIAWWTDAIGKVRLADLDVVKVERALARMSREGLSRASLIKARSTLRQALAWGQKRRLVAFNAAAAAELPTDAKAARKKRALTADELRRLLEALRGHRWAPMYALMGRCGLRPGEASGVCADALDLKSKPPTVSIVRAVRLEKSRPVLVDELKTSGARRTLAMPSDVAQMLRSLTFDDGPLFTSSDGSPVWPSTMRGELADACERAGVPVISPNELRHTAATLMADSGLPPHVVADILGHRTTRMVDEVYRHRPPVIRGADKIP